MNFDAKFETQEPHVESSKINTVLICLAAVFVICGVLMAIFHPEAEFTWLFGEIKYFLGLFIIAVFCILIWLWNLGEHRDEKYYFTPDGKLDLSVPRSYTSLKRHKIVDLITRKGSVDKFAYDGEGNVYIKFRNGEELTSPLEELTVSYTMDKAQGSGEFYVDKMKVTTPDGKTYKVKYGARLEDSEYNDIFMILSTAGTLKETKISKATKWVSKLKDAMDNFDFSDLVGSGIMIGGGVGASLLGERKTADNNVITFVKAQVFEDKKKKPWFKKAMEYFWYIVAILYVIVVLIVNIAALPEIFGGVDKGYDEYIEELKEENGGDYLDDISNQEGDEASVSPIDLSLYGIYGETVLKMDITLYPDTRLDGMGEEYNVQGTGYFEEDYGTTNFVLRGLYNDNGVMILHELSDHRGEDVLYIGTLHEQGGELIYDGNRYWDGEDAGEFYLRYID